MYRMVTQTVDNDIQASAMAGTFALTGRYADNLSGKTFSGQCQISTREAAYLDGGARRWI